MKQIILNLVKLAFTISLFVSFIGCAAKTTAPPTGDIASSNSIEDETINDDSGSGGEEQSAPKDSGEKQNGSNGPGDKGTMNTTNVNDSGDLELNRANGVTTAEVGGTTYLFVVGLNDDGVSVFSIANDGTLMNTTNVSDGGNLELDGARGVTTVEIDGKHYLFVTGFIDNGFSVFSLGNDGTVMNRANVSDGGNLELDGVNGVTTAEIDGNHYLFVAGQDDDGVSMFSVADDGTLVNTTNVNDDGNLELNGANEVTTAEVDGNHYLFVAGLFDNGFSVFSVGNDGTLMNTTNVSDSSALNLDGAIGVTTAEIDGKHYLFVAGAGISDNGVSVFEFGLRPETP